MEIDNIVYTQQELYTAINDFFSHDEIIDHLAKALFDPKTLSIKPVNDAEELLESVMDSVCNMLEYGLHFDLADDLGEIFPQSITYDVLVERAAIWSDDGFITHIIGDDIYAFKTERTQDEDGTVFKVWSLGKQICNEEKSIMTIADYSYKGKMFLMKGKNTDEWLLYQ